MVREGEWDADSADFGGSVPWSGSWLPLKSDALFEKSDGSLAPLQKYDLYMELAHGLKTHAADTEKNDPEMYNPNALGWEGRCDAWAAASVFEREPTKPVTLNGITFSVGDLKDLLIKTYENTSALKSYGHNFEASVDADFEQIYPDQFHKAVQHELFENHRVLVFDSDPTEQVWNTPLLAAQFQIQGDGANSHLLHVTAYITGVIALGVSPTVTDPDYTGAIKVQFIYTYDLMGDRQGDGSFKVAYGEWTGDSKADHPNFVSLITNDRAHSSLNSEISTFWMQEHPGTGRTLAHARTGKVDFEELARSLGIQNVFVIDP